MVDSTSLLTIITLQKEGARLGFNQFDVNVSRPPRLRYDVAKTYINSLSSSSAVWGQIMFRMICMGYCRATFATHPVPIALFKE